MFHVEHFEASKGSSPMQPMRFAANIEAASRKRMRSGDRPGLQNRRAAGFPVTGGFDSHSLPPLFNGLASAPAVSPAVECQTSDFSTSHSHFIRDHITINIHRGSDVRVAHKFLLHGNRSPYGIKPTAVT